MQANTDLKWNWLNPTENFGRSFTRGGYKGGVCMWMHLNTLTTTLTSWWPNKLTNKGRIPESITSCSMKSNQSPFRKQYCICTKLIISHTWIRLRILEKEVSRIYNYDNSAYRNCTAVSTFVYRADVMREHSRQE